MSENSTRSPNNEATSIQPAQQELIDKVISDPEVLEGVLSAPSVQMVITQQYSGPLPPPKDLSEYNSLIPHAAHRIMSMAEKEQDARHKFNSDMSKSRDKGQNYAMCSVILITALCSYLAYLGAYAVVGTIMVSALVAIVGSFIIGKKLSSNTSSEK